jgi:hypothetical protein
MTLPALPPSNSPDWDDLLDAATYLSVGEWPEYERLARQISSDPWSAAASAHRLAALGHLDLVLNRGRAERWSIAPATIVIPSGCAPFLAGARSQALIRWLGDQAQRMGGSLHAVRQREAPSLIFFEGLTEVQLSSLVADGAQRILGGLALAHTPGERLAKALPTLAQAVLDSNAVPIPHGPYERFDPCTARWETRESVQNAGGYRAVGNGRLCFAMTASDWSRGECRLSTVYAVKHMAAIIEDQRLVRYDPATCSLEVPLGAELPGLYGRAAVLCSGRVPEKVGGRSRYVGVPQDVAQALMARLGGGGSPRA